MLISTSITNEIQVEIPIPFFSRSKDGDKYIGVLDEKTFLKIVILDGYICIQNTCVSISKIEIVEAYNKFNSCSESEFVEAYDKVIESISLHPAAAANRKLTAGDLLRV